MTAKFNQLLFRKGEHNGRILPPLTKLALTLWLCSMISLPILKWWMGDAAVPQGVTMAVLLQTTAVLFILKGHWSWQRLGQTCTVIILFTLLIEIVGSHTGYPFGQYAYTPLLQPQIGGVPLLIPLAWLMMLPPSWAVALQVAKRPFSIALVSALALTAWDLLIDPQMVSWRLWVWEQPGGYFGIPWLNFFGWFMTALLLTWFLRPSHLPIRPLLFIYTVTWFLESFGLLLFWQLPGPALAGGSVMGLVTLVAWRGTNLKT